MIVERAPEPLPRTPPGHMDRPYARPPAFTHLPSLIEGPPARMTPEHRYVTPEGQAYASVTTVLGATKSEHDLQKLEEWRKKVGYGVAEHITREAATIGTQAHMLNEYYLNGRTPDESDDNFRLIARAHFENFRPHLDRIDRIRGTELVLHSDTIRLAGTSDCIAEYEGVPSIIDYKTKRSPQKVEWIHDYFLQGAAYSLMYGESSGVRVGQTVILVSSEMDTMQAFTAKTADYVDEFMERLNLFCGRRAYGGMHAMFEDVQEAASAGFGV